MCVCFLRQGQTAVCGSIGRHESVEVEKLVMQQGTGLHEDCGSARHAGPRVQVGRGEGSRARSLKE